MAQTGFTPLQIYSSSTVAAAPAVGNLTNSTLGSELAINITDGKLFYKDNANAIQVIGWKVVPAVAGGTGQTSYAVGDILFANTTTSLAKLADVATGNALISGGVGVAPAYGKIGLTTHISGVLPVANGGTNASTASITSFNNITGFTALGATGTTSTNLVFSTSPTLTTPTIATIKSAASLTPTAFQDSAGIEIGKLCRAWVYFDGTTAPPTIKQSFNVTSVSKSAGTGTYDITITNALPNAEPTVVTGYRRTSAFNEILDVINNSNTSTNVRVRNSDTSGVGADSVAVYVGVFA
jgi:hypothetical protein